MRLLIGWRGRRYAREEWIGLENVMGSGKWIRNRRAAGSRWPLFPRIRACLFREWWGRVVPIKQRRRLDHPGRPKASLSAPEMPLQSNG